MQLPGVTDVDRAKEIIRSTAQLELKQVEQGPFSDENAARAALGNNLPPDMQILPGTIEAAPGQPASTGYYVVRRVPAVTGRDLRTARPTLDENNRPAVSFSLNQEGARKFGTFTQANIGRQLGIVLDNRVQSAPRHSVAHRRRGPHHRQLHQPGSAGPVAEAALGRAAGEPDLPRRAHRRPVARRRLDPRRRDCRRPAACCSSRCSCWSTTRLAGFNALISIAVNLIILLGLMAYAGATMTLPGIAGFILTIGMGVDSNVLIFERIKEELQARRRASSRRWPRASIACC